MSNPFTDNPHDAGSPEFLQHLIDNPVDLDPELQEHTTEQGWIHHPLYISPFHVKELNGMANQALAQKRAALEEALNTGNWMKYVILHERPYRLDAFLLIDGDVDDDADYWSLVSDIWTDSENIFQHLTEWLDIFDADNPRGDRERIMHQSERDALARMDPVIRIYRGSHRPFPIDRQGLSWTLDREKAEWFSTRLMGTREAYPRVLTGTIMRDNVIAYFTDRGEEEIVALPADVTVEKVTTMTR